MKNIKIIKFSYNKYNYNKMQLKINWNKEILLIHQSNKDNNNF